MADPIAARPQLKKWEDLPDHDDDGAVDVDRYNLPDESHIKNPYLKKVFAMVRHQFEGGEFSPDDDTE